MMKLPPPLVTALRTLTILPVPGDDAERPADSLVWFAATGALIGSILWGVHALLSALLPGADPRILAVAVVIGGALLTRGLHLDGLADWADAYWGGWTPERRLEIMKDSSLGTFGTVALVLLLLAKWAALCTLLESAEPVWIILACVISRSIQVDLAASHDYARPEGGTGAAFIKEASSNHQWIALTTALVFVLALGTFSLRHLAIALAAWGAGRLFGASCRKHFGGVTGDLLGAGSELGETLVLLLAAATVA